MRWGTKSITSYLLFKPYFEHLMVQYSINFSVQLRKFYDFWLFVILYG